MAGDTETMPATTRLIYIADPMCSWCYGFGPELQALLAEVPDFATKLVMGGLRAYNTQPLDGGLRETLRSHWHKVGATTGLPFCDAALELPGLIYDTEPACRAVVTVRRLAPQATLASFHAVQQAFYAQGQDTTQAQVLADALAPVLSRQDPPVMRDAFLQEWSSLEAQAATRADFLQAKRWDITGFPTLLLARGDKLHLLAAGFMRVAQLRERLDASLEDKD